VKRPGAEGAPLPVPTRVDVLAAGGVVRRRVDGKERVAVVRRNRHGGDWTLPKGHCESGETLQDAAIREVREETGWRASPVSLIGATNYATDEGEKYVLFWTMDADAPVPEGPMVGEVEAVDWLTYRDARRRLSYPKEIDILARAQPRRGHLRMFVPTVFRSSQPERLEEGIQTTWSSLRLCPGFGGDAEPTWVVQAEANLRDAEAALALGEVDRGWALVHRTHELQVFGYDDAQVTSEATTVHAELSSPKFGAWRRNAITQHLDQVFALNEAKSAWKWPLHDRQIWLAGALRTRHESYANEYQNLRLVRRFQSILLLIAVLILVGALIGAAFANSSFQDGPEKWWVVLGAALSGALGGITSALQRTTRRSVARIPERLGSLVHSLSRPIIGAIAGVTVLLAVRAGITQAGSESEQQVAYVLLLAFGAGFSERLVVRDPREEVDATRDNAAPSAPPVVGESAAHTDEEINETPSNAKAGASTSNDSENTAATSVG
jgi:8-oxo-dGTP pyrophosphatase MutT (NUDIX family)